MPATADRERARRLMLRSFVAVSGVLAIVLALLGASPGYERYAGCFAFDETVASSPLGLAAVLAALVALGAFVWHRPLLANALLWSVISCGLSVFMFAFTVPLYDLDSYLVVVLPTARIAHQLMIALMAIQVVLLPIACGLFALATREPRPDPIARARVVRRRRD